MSRTKKGTKGPGFDYWGKRGSFDKDTTKGSERMSNTRDLKKEIKKHKKRLKRFRKVWSKFAAREITSPNVQFMETEHSCLFNG
jgi:hypothetical protein